jgi:predicted nuclease of predicted toxin-antitoxin system
MRFLADECCDTALVSALRDDGHDILYVLETMRGSRDTQILERAFEEDRILITEDKDFGEIAIRLRRPVKAIVLLRFDIHEKSQKIPRIRHLLEQEGKNIPGKFIVLEANKIRSRQLDKE